MKNKCEKSDLLRVQSEHFIIIWRFSGVLCWVQGPGVMVAFWQTELFYSIFNVSASQTKFLPHIFFL